jgi:hypothetical protein
MADCPAFSFLDVIGMASLLAAHSLAGEYRVKQPCVFPALDTPHSAAHHRMSDQPVTETLIWQHTTLTRERDAGFEPAVPASKQPQTHAIDLAATGIGLFGI